MLVSRSVKRFRGGRYGKSSDALRVLWVMALVIGVIGGLGTALLLYMFIGMVVCWGTMLVAGGFTEDWLPAGDMLWFYYLLTVSVCIALSSTCLFWGCTFHSNLSPKLNIFLFFFSACASTANLSFWISSCCSFHCCNKCDSSFFLSTSLSA